MPLAVLGTAHLYGAMSDAESEALLDAAWGAGFRAFDTAPLYGHGRSEAALGARLAHWPERPQLTSKVGLEPAGAASRGTRIAKAAVRRLPTAAQRRLRPGDGVPRGSFDPELIRSSVARTFDRLGRVDRLMLHEAHAEDLGADALEVLTTVRDRGDAGQIGVATVNAAAAGVVRRAAGLVVAAHVEIGPFAPAADLPPGLVTIVGHGVLGPAASGLRRLDTWAAGGHATAARWREISGGTRWRGTPGLAAALVARAAALPVADVIVATSRPERLADLHALASGEDPLPDDVASALTRMIDAAARA